MAITSEVRNQSLTVSDSLRINITTTNLTPSQAILLFKSFGDLARKQLFHSHEAEFVSRWLEVSFFDIRHACHAKCVLGDCCSFAPMYGQRSIRLLSSANLDANVLSQVAEIAKTDDGDFLMHFFDSRCAAEVAARAYSPPTRQCLDPQSESVDQTESISKMSVDSKSQLLRSQLCWADLASRKETRTALHLRGLPKKLCEGSALEVLLKANGLALLVQEVRILPKLKGQLLGCAVLQANSVEAVTKLARFFHGRSIAGSRPIAVSFAEDVDKDLNRLPTRTRSECQQRSRSPSSAEASDVDSFEAGDLPVSFARPPPPPGLSCFAK
jgi:hypothetical protein